MKNVDKGYRRNKKLDFCLAIILIKKYLKIEKNTLYDGERNKNNEITQGGGAYSRHLRMCKKYSGEPCYIFLSKEWSFLNKNDFKI